ncbi:MAG: hypothetical protein ABIP78_07265 [Pyrinomonadaceae bacterium]
MRNIIDQPISRSFLNLYWRHLVMAIIVVGSLIGMISQPPFGQDQNYHNFADSRTLLGIPNFGDVASNLGFLIAGLLGLKICFEEPLGALHRAWIVMFAGIALVGVASSYYHWNPNDYTLVWDRMSLTVGFMGLFVGLLGEYISERFRLFLVPAILMGVFSVLYWNWFQDLRFYYWIQLIPLLILPFMMMLYPAKYSHQWLVLAGAIWYGLAKLAELGDKVVFAATQGIISGHTIKHIFAAVGCISILTALKKRKPLEL